MNDLAFVQRVQRVLGSFGVETWIFGGWAEEIRGLIRPREHADVDLLYPAESWDDIERLPFDWIEGKRFPWKRAFLLEGTVVELFLVQRDDRGLYTALERRVHRWPDSLLSSAGRIRVASTAALSSYRHSYRVDAA